MPLFCIQRLLRAELDGGFLHFKHSPGQARVALSTDPVRVNRGHIGLGQDRLFFLLTGVEEAITKQVQGP